MNTYVIRSSFEDCLIPTIDPTIRFFVSNSCEIIQMIYEDECWCVGKSYLIQDIDQIKDQLEQHNYERLIHNIFNVV